MQIEFVYLKNPDPDNPNKNILDYECIDSNHLLSTINLTEGRKNYIKLMIVV